MNLEEVKKEFLQQCGACDAGLPMACAHSDRDYRPTMLALVDELELAREKVERQHEALANLAENVAKFEAALAVSYDDLLAYKDYYGTSPAQVRHLQSCTRCDVGSYVDKDSRPCPDYPTE